jgi:hypothetical protein
MSIAASDEKITPYWGGPCPPYNVGEKIMDSGLRFG